MKFDDEKQAHEWLVIVQRSSIPLVGAVWRFGLSEVFPWWLLSWHHHIGTVHSKYEYIEWPSDLKDSVMSDPTR